MVQKLEIKLDASNRKNDPYFDGLGNEKQIVIFSSHLDDAVLSCGSLISYLIKRGLSVTVCSIFTDTQNGRSQSIDTILKRAGFEDSLKYIKARKDEDGKALSSLGVKTINHLDFMDAAWRIDTKGNHIYPSSQVGIVSELDNDIRDEVTTKLKEYTSQFENAVFLAPLARGNHIDHQIVRDAVEKVTKNIIFYEDFPYSGKFDNQDEFIEKRNLKRHVFSSDLEEKKDAILLYVSQQESFRVFLDGSFNLSTETYYSL